MAAPTFARAIPERAGACEPCTWNTHLGAKPRIASTTTGARTTGEQLWRISARVGALNDLDYGVFVDDLRKVVEPVLAAYRDDGVEGISATYTGVVPLVYKAQHSLFDGLIFGFAGDLILIGVAMILLMRNWSAGTAADAPQRVSRWCSSSAPWGSWESWSTRAR